MSKKESFLDFVRFLMQSANFYDWDEDAKNEWADALTYLEALKISEDKEKTGFTENGRLVLDFMQKNREDFNNLFKAKDVGERMGISSRTVSGAMRKLVTDNFVEKLGSSPTVYSLTNKGIEVKIEVDNT